MKTKKEIKEKGIIYYLNGIVNATVPDYEIKELEEFYRNILTKDNIDTLTESIFLGLNKVCDYVVEEYLKTGNKN